MKIHKFSTFVNEMIHQHGPTRSGLEAVAASLITKANFHKEDLWYERDKFVRTLQQSLGLTDDDKVTAASLAKNPKFDELSHKMQSIITAKAGIGKKSPNGEFIKLFATALHQFPKWGHDDTRWGDSLIQVASAMKRSFDEGTYPDWYYGIPYDYARKLRELIPGHKIKETLTEDEFKFLQKLLKPKYEDVIKRELTDEKIEKAILWCIVNDHDAKGGKDVEQFAKGIHLKTDLPELFEKLKENMLSGAGNNWKSFDVKLTYAKSDHSEVHSSSFSTYYYYDVDVTFDGKHYEKKAARLGSDYFSGGWN